VISLKPEEFFHFGYFSDAGVVREHNEEITGNAHSSSEELQNEANRRGGYENCTVQKTDIYYQEKKRAKIPRLKQGKSIPLRGLAAKIGYLSVAIILFSGAILCTARNEPLTTVKCQVREWTYQNGPAYSLTLNSGKNDRVRFLNPTVPQINASTFNVMASENHSPDRVVLSYKLLRGNQELQGSGEINN